MLELRTFLLILSIFWPISNMNANGTSLFLPAFDFFAFSLSVAFVILKELYRFWPFLTRYCPYRQHNVKLHVSNMMNRRNNIFCINQSWDDTSANVKSDLHVCRLDIFKKIFFNVYNWVKTRRRHGQEVQIVVAGTLQGLTWNALVMSLRTITGLCASDHPLFLSTVEVNILKVE